MLNTVVEFIRLKLWIVHVWEKRLLRVEQERYELLFELQNHIDFVSEAKDHLKELDKEIKNREKRIDLIIEYFEDHGLVKQYTGRNKEECVSNS